MGDDRRLVVAVLAQQRRRSTPRRFLERPSVGRVVVDAVGEPARPRSATSSSSASRPASRSASGSNRGRGGRAPRASWRGERRSRRGRRAVAGERVAERRAPRAIASPCWAASSRARISSASPGRSRGRGDLVRLVLGELEPARQLARIDASSRSAARLARQRATGAGHRRTQLVVAAERVEQVALPALVEQALLLVLAVDLDERPDLVRQAGGGDRRVVDPGASERPPAPTRRGRAISGSGSRSNSASTRAVSAPWRTSDVSARAPSARPRASMSRLLPAPVSPVMTLRPGVELEAQPVDERQVGDRQLEQAARQRCGLGHDGSSSTLCRSRSQNGCAPRGLDEADRPSTARTSTTSPTAIGRSSRPSTRDERLVRVDDPAADDLRRGSTTTERIAER